MSYNIDEKEFKMNLKLAQEDLEDILGYNFYDEINTQYSAQGDTLSAANSTLYESYIKDYLAWRTYSISLGLSQSKSTPTGERIFSDENSTILEDIKLASKEKNINARANRYKYKMISYMRLQQQILSTNFPLWIDDCKVEFSWGISSITRDSAEDQGISIDKAITTNE